MYVAWNDLNGSSVVLGVSVFVYLFVSIIQHEEERRRRPAEASCLDGGNFFELL